MGNLKNNRERGEVHSAHLGRYILIGFLTVASLWVTWRVFDFLLNLRFPVVLPRGCILLAKGIGGPLLKATVRAIRPFSDTAAS